MARPRSSIFEQRRREAKKAGEPRFFGKPCTKCGGEIRYTGSGCCVPCHSKKVTHYEASRPFAKKIRDDKYKITKDRLNKQRRLRRDKNPEKYKQVVDLWRKENSEKIANYNFKHKARRSELTKIWKKENPERHKIHQKVGAHNKRARLKKIGGKLSTKIILKMLHDQWGLCYWCGEDILKKYEVEHIIPISRGGDNSKDNVALSCRACNAQKNNKLPEEWFNTIDCRGKLNDPRAVYKK